MAKVKYYAKEDTPHTEACRVIHLALVYFYRWEW